MEVVKALLAYALDVVVVSRMTLSEFQDVLDVGDWNACQGSDIRFLEIFDNFFWQIHLLSFYFFVRSVRAYFLKKFKKK